MNILSRFLLLSCVCLSASVIQAVTITEKSIQLGLDPKDQKQLITKGFSLAEENDTEEPAWFATFLQNDKLYFCIECKGILYKFEVTHLLSLANDLMAQTNPDVPINVPVNDKIILSVKTSPEVKLFLELVMAISAKNNLKKQNLQKILDRFAKKDIETCIVSAVQCKAFVMPIPDNVEESEKLLQSADKPKEPVCIACTLYFVPEEVLANPEQTPS